MCTTMPKKNPSASENLMYSNRVLARSSVTRLRGKRGKLNYNRFFPEPTHNFLDHPSNQKVGPRGQTVPHNISNVRSTTRNCKIPYSAPRASERGRGVRHGAVRRTRFGNPVDFRWISGFQFGFLDFWISKWISGFQSGFLDFKVDFWISKWRSGFQSGFLDFKVDFLISSGFLDFKADFWISKWISGFQADFWISKRISGFRYF